jgi:hypothetical protein
VPFWGTEARTETSRFKTLPRGPCVAVNPIRDTLLPAAWLSVPRDRGLSVSALCDSEPTPQNPTTLGLSIRMRYLFALACLLIAPAETPADVVTFPGAVAEAYSAVSDMKGDLELPEAKVKGRHPVVQYGEHASRTLRNSIGRS